MLRPEVVSCSQVVSNPLAIASLEETSTRVCGHHGWVDVESEKEELTSEKAQQLEEEVVKEV